MNETSLQTESPEPEKATPALSEPHFDRTTIATARPVEPLAEAGRRGTLVEVIRHFSVAAILFAVVVIVSVATFGIAGLDEQSINNEPAAAAKPAEESIEPKATVGAMATEQESARRSKPRKAKANFPRSRRVARKVGTIYYGR